MPTTPYNADSPDMLLFEHTQKMAQQFFERQAKANSDLKALYHYTSAEGLQSILKGRSFWASDISYLNDSSELAYGTELFNERLAALVESRKCNYVGQFVKYLSEAIGPFFRERFRTYIVCFCSNGDQLSQWRGY
ncbi:hypothetical protein SAMN04515620_11430 [Collimonas sp. OK607]|uniref:hypothetical protein n=1 Tax=Collimonas sp. OK607 TaxID=1798194 RepID=UPI0008F403DA|nr:hypothetical protein [Collimonas sp. OK607]SFB04113.1 hypothetical protein SAMN04515620_11430 [Collimonas sp. OK607]